MGSTPEQFEELKRRLAELDADPEGGESSWDEVQARILKSL